MRKDNVLHPHILSFLLFRAFLSVPAILRIAFLFTEGRLVTLTAAGVSIVCHSQQQVTRAEILPASLKIG